LSKDEGHSSFGSPEAAGMRAEDSTTKSQSELLERKTSVCKSERHQLSKDWRRGRMTTGSKALWLTMSSHKFWTGWTHWSLLTSHSFVDTFTSSSFLLLCLSYTGRPTAATNRNSSYHHRSTLTKYAHKWITLVVRRSTRLGRSS
jgi:hypothetical protein